jgi:hypothetical protein
VQINNAVKFSAGATGVAGAVKTAGVAGAIKTPGAAGVAFCSN